MKITKAKKTGGMAQVVEHKGLSSKPSLTKIKRKKLLLILKGMLNRVRIVFLKK
jgi:hypothetical protein